MPTDRAVKRKRKLQSAIEYLTTYSWALLVIAIVLVSLYYFGVFNPFTLAPKAVGGSCQVIRPFGPGTTKAISLQGSCLNEIPQEVANFNASSLYGCTTSGAPYIDIPNIAQPSSFTSLTLTYWAKPISGSSIVVLHFINSCPGGWGDLSTFPSAYYLYNPAVGGNCGPYSLPAPSSQSYEFIAIVLNGASGTATAYFNGTSYSSSSWGGTLGLIGEADFGVYAPSCNDNYQGYISNVQVYGAALSPTSVKQLYKEGRGGAPVDLNDLVGWWQLNGDANDYSGNNNNGVASGVAYVLNWYNGYTNP